MVAPVLPKPGTGSVGKLKKKKEKEKDLKDVPYSLQRQRTVSDRPDRQ